MIRDRKEYLRKWREEKLRANPDYFKESQERARQRRKQKLESDPELARKVRVKALENRSKSRRIDPRVQLLADARKRAKRKGIEYDLTVDDFPVHEYCPVLGIKLEVGIGKRHSASPSIDRIDNTKGYVRGNVMIISLRANSLKNDASIEEMKMIVKYMEEYNGVVCN